MTIRTVLTSIFGFLWLALDALRKTLHLILLLIIFIVILAALKTSVPVIPGTAALVLNPQGRLVEQLSGDAFERALSKASSSIARETQLRDIIEALDAAATDKRIKAVVLDLKDFEGGGLSKLQEVGAALEKFRTSGKKVIAINEYYDQAAYYLAAHADEINVDPLGGVLIEGYARYSMYFKEALQKAGVEMNIFKVGTHKSAVEPFTRTDMSPEERQQSLAYLDVLWKAYQADVTRARKLPAAALGNYVAQAVPLMQQAGGDAAQVALDNSLVTAIKTREQVNAELKALVGEDERTHLFKAVELTHYVAAVRAERAIKAEPDNKVAIIVAAGEILDGSQPPGRVGGESLARAIRDAREDDNIKAVVLRVDSPGGSVMASERIYRELLALQQAGKPVVTSMSSVAASGGYYIAMGTDEIWASPTTITGSIGVFATIPTFQNTLRKLGVTTDGVGTTDMAGAMSLERALSPKAKALIQTGVEHTYREFLARVARNRDSSPEAVEPLAQGRVWPGVTAREHGLVDGIGDLAAAVGAASARANLGGDFKVMYLEPELTWQEALGLKVRATLGRVAGMVGLARFLQPPAAELVRRVADPIEAELARWGRFNDPRGFYSYCFCGMP